MKAVPDKIVHDFPHFDAQAIGSDVAGMRAAATSHRQPTFWETLTLRAKEVLRLRLRVSDLRAKGEDDPATDEFKCMDAAYGIALTSYEEISRPQNLLSALASTPSPAVGGDAARLHGALQRIRNHLAQHVCKVDRHDQLAFDAAVDALEPPVPGKVPFDDNA